MRTADEAHDQRERFAWRYLRRKLAAAGVELPDKDLAALVRVVRQTLPGESAPEGQPAQAGPATVGQRLTRFSLCLRRADVNVELNANTCEPMGWSCPQLARGNTRLTETEALRVAEAAALPPPNAVLVEHGYEEIAGEPVFVAHWQHREDSVLVERDYIRVLVSGHSGRVFAFHRRWHAVDLAASVR